MTPDATAALRELDELAGHLSAHINRDLLEAFGRIVNDGTPVLQIDRIAAVGAEKRVVVVYKLSHDLKILLAAARARNLDAPEGVGGSSHGLVSTMTETDA
jgi:hypothetical protein